MKTEFELQIEKWWDSLSENQQNYLNEKFYKDEIIDTFEKVKQCYTSLNNSELLELNSK